MWHGRGRGEYRSLRTFSIFVGSRESYQVLNKEDSIGSKKGVRSPRPAKSCKFA